LAKILIKTQNFLNPQSSMHHALIVLSSKTSRIKIGQKHSESSTVFRKMWTDRRQTATRDGNSSS